MKLVLASQSPRRKELLEKAGFDFSVHSIQISEIPNENMSLAEQIEDLARQKAEALVDAVQDSQSTYYNSLNLKGVLILSADTLVVLGNEVLGKPKDLAESETYLRRLSGCTHQVITGICVWNLDKNLKILDHKVSHVTFRKLREDQIRSYVDSGDGLDKAGAYGIQTLERDFIEKIEGPIDNVIGLPVDLVKEILKKNNWNV